MLAGRLPAAARCPGGLIQEGAELQGCSKRAKACSYKLRICRRGSQPFQLKCKGSGMQESLFSIPVATHTPEPLPPPAQTDGAAFGVHCWLPTQLLSAQYLPR